MYLVITKQLAPKHLISKCISNIFLLQSLIPSSGFYYSFNGVSWYLSLTMVLYILFPYIKKWIEEKDPILMSCILFFIMILYCGIVGIISPSADVSKWLVYINPFFRYFDFSIGCCAAMIYKTGRFKNKTLEFLEILFCLLSIGSIILFGKLKTSESFMWLIYSLIYVPAIYCGLLSISHEESILSKVLGFKPFVWLGNISGYTFLIHQIAIWYAGAILSKLGLNNLLRIVASFIITVLLAIAYDYVIKYRAKKKDLIAN